MRPRAVSPCGSAQVRPYGPARSDGHDFLRLCLDRLVDLLDLLVCLFLKIILQIRQLILRDLILQLLESLVGVPADVSDGNLRRLALFLDLLGKLFSSLLCQAPGRSDGSPFHPSSG